MSAPLSSPLVAISAPCTRIRANTECLDQRTDAPPLRATVRYGTTAPPFFFGNGGKVSNRDVGATSFLPAVFGFFGSRLLRF